MHNKAAYVSLIICAIAYFPNIAFAETISLKSGKKIEGKVIEKTDKYIKLDFYGTPITYFIDEIESIDGQKIVHKEHSSNNDKKIDLEEMGTSVSGQINAAVIYRESIDNLKGIPDNFIDKAKEVINNGWLAGHSDIRELLLQNQKAIDDFKRASELAYCDFTFGKTVEKTANAPLPFSGNILMLARLVLLEARFYEKENKMGLALENYISLLRFKNHLDRQVSFVLISQTLGNIVQNLIYAPLTQFIARKDLNLQECKYLQDTLIFMKNNRVGPEKIFEEEREVSRNTIRSMGVEAKRQGNYDEDFYQTLYKEFDDFSEELNKYLMEAAKENRPEIYKERVDAFSNELKTERLKLPLEAFKNLIGLPSEFRNYTPSRIAKILASVGAESYGRIIPRYYINFAKFNILLAAVTVRLYALRNHRTLDSFQELVPDYTLNLPEDPFDDFKPLKFEKRDKGWVIYSFGPDKSDNKANIIHSGKDENIDETGDIVLLSQS